MFTETKHVLAAVALIVTTGVVTVEATRTPAKADPLLATSADYAAVRISDAFNVAATMPAVEPIAYTVAEKGDRLPIGCAGPLDPTVAAECLDTAYELASEDDVVVETRSGATSILTRMERLTVAGY